MPKAIIESGIGEAPDAFGKVPQCHAALVATRKGRWPVPVLLTSSSTPHATALLMQLHASMLWALGLDRLRVTYMHNGRAERPTVVAGEVIKQLFA